MGRWWILGLAELVGLIQASPTQAELSKSFPVTATIASGCVISNDAGGNWGAINFGSVNGLVSSDPEADLTSGGATGLRLDCTPGMTVNVAADSGDQASGGVRRMRNLSSATSFIAYDLLVGSSLTTWTTQAVAVNFPAGTSRITLPVKARAHINGPAKSGDYTDNIRVTLTW